MDHTKALTEYFSLRSRNTAKLYRRIWGEWSRFLGDICPLEATPLDVTSYIASLKKRGLSDQTLRSAYAALSSLYGYLVDVGCLPTSPTKKAKRSRPIRVKQVRPTPIIPERIVLEALNHPSASTREGIRDRALLALFFGAALRISEVQALNVRDIGRLGKAVTLRLWSPKSGEVQQIAVDNFASDAIKKLQAQREKEGASPLDPFLVHYRGKKYLLKRISMTAIFQKYKKIMRECGIEAAPHSARATAATTAARRGATDTELMNLLRHRTRNQIEVYVKRDFALRETPTRKILYTLS